MPEVVGAGLQVNVIHGCNERCTYCVVPNTRGVEQSRTPEAIRVRLLIPAWKSTSCERPDQPWKCSCIPVSVNLSEHDMQDKGGALRKELQGVQDVWQ